MPILLPFSRTCGIGIVAKLDRLPLSLTYSLRLLMQLCLPFRLPLRRPKELRSPRIVKNDLVLRDLWRNLQGFGLGVPCLGMRCDNECLLLTPDLHVFRGDLQSEGRD